MSNRLDVSLGSTVAVAREQISSELAGEVVILNLKAGVYHGLDRTGARVWQLVQQPRRVAEIRDALLAEYDVEPQTCERDLLQFLADMAGQGLLDVRHETAA
jgi:hypothetical protein